MALSKRNLKLMGKGLVSCLTKTATVRKEFNQQIGIHIYHHSYTFVVVVVVKLFMCSFCLFICRCFCFSFSFRNCRPSPSLDCFTVTVK